MTSFTRAIAASIAAFLAAAAFVFAAGVASAGAPGAADRTCSGCAFLAENVPTYPKKRYSKRAARKAWLEHKRTAGEKGRRDLERKPGSNEGWVDRLRRAQEKHAERVAKANARKARKERARARKSSKKSPRKSARVVVFENPASDDKDRGDWNARDDGKDDAKPRKRAPSKNGDDKDDSFKPNWNDRPKKDAE
jgi:hypothetical protein